MKLAMGNGGIAPFFHPAKEPLTTGRVPWCVKYTIIRNLSRPADLNTSGTYAGAHEAAGCRGDWITAFQNTAAPLGELSGRDWMIDKKDESMKARPEKQASEGAMDIPQGNKVNPDAKAPPVQDRWFDTQLSRMYADLASEPVPKDMLNLLDKLKANKSQ